MKPELFDRILKTRGQLLAGFSHELRNHLAIIKESNGLLQDYLEFGENINAELRDKFEKISSKIDDRVGQASTMSKHLNNFAHSTDKTVQAINLSSFLDELIFFHARLARIKKKYLIPKYDYDNLSVIMKTELLQFILSTLLCNFLEDAPAKEENIYIHLICNSSTKAIEVSPQQTPTVHHENYKKIDSPEDTELSQALQLTKLSIRLKQKTDTMPFFIELPQ